MSEVRRFKLRHLGMSGGADAMELWVAPDEDFPSGRETPIVLASDHDRVVAEMQKQIDELKENHRKDEDVWIARLARLETALFKIGDYDTLDGGKYNSYEAGWHGVAEFARKAIDEA